MASFLHSAPYEASVLSRLKVGRPTEQFEKIMLELGQLQEVARLPESS